MTIREVLLLLIACMLSVACNVERHVFASRSPDGASVVHITNAAALGGLVADRAVIEVRSARRLLWKKVSHDTDQSPCFAATKWAPDSSTVAIYYANCWGESMLTGFDIRHGRELSSEWARPIIERELKVICGIRQDYPSDIMRWTRSEEGRNCFKPSWIDR